jgi:hypothetical protein
MLKETPSSHQQDREKLGKMGRMQEPLGDRKSTYILIPERIP